MNLRYHVPNLLVNNSDVREVRRIIDSGWVANGSYCRQLENWFTATHDVKHAIACCNATQGLVCAVKAAGLKNKKIAVPAFTWESTRYAIECNSNFPSVVDVEPDTWMMDKRQLKNLGVDAVMPVDVFGNQCDIGRIHQVTIYDAAHGFGLPKLGHRGDIEVVSLAQTKLTTGCQGGVVLTNNDIYATKVRELVALSAKMTEISAYLALVSIENYECTKKIVVEAIDKYKSMIKLPYETQKIPKFTNNSVFGLLFETTYVRDKIRLALADAGVETKVYYTPLSLNCKNAMNIYNRILCLPVYYEVLDYIDEICKVINGVI